MKIPLPDTSFLAREVAERLDELGQVSDEADCLVRTFLSPASRQANALVGCWMSEAGLTVDEDTFGNLTGTREGTPGSGKWVIGSHLDTVVDAGRFDGPAGVLLGIALAAALPELPFGLEVVGFSDEEGVRFQSPYLGSRAYTGLITAEELGQRGKDGISVGFTGKAGHAGTTPMRLRRDALTAASKMVLATEAYALVHAPLLSTVGKMEVLPGAGNVIPGEVHFSLDVRSPDDAAREAALANLAAQGSALAEEHGVTWHWEVKQDYGAVAFDVILTEKLAQAVAAGQAEVPAIFSGAGHDAAVLAGVCPAAMLLVRCRDGLSHHPDEYATPADLAAALAAAVRFMLSLAEDYHA